MAARSVQCRPKDFHPSIKSTLNCSDRIDAVCTGWYGCEGAAEGCAHDQVLDPLSVLKHAWQSSAGAQLPAVMAGHQWHPAWWSQRRRRRLQIQLQPSALQGPCEAHPVLLPAAHRASLLHCSALIERPMCSRTRR